MLVFVTESPRRTGFAYEIATGSPEFCRQPRRVLPHRASVGTNELTQPDTSRSLVVRRTANAR
jgi:hypothetical protein